MGFVTRIAPSWFPLAVRSGLRAEVAEWQTRRSQTPLRATSCGFESHLRYQGFALAPRRNAGRMTRFANAVSVAALLAAGCSAGTAPTPSAGATVAFPPRAV